MSLKPDDLAQIILDSIDDDEPPTALYTLNIHEARMLANAVQAVANLADRLDHEADSRRAAGQDPFEVMTIRQEAARIRTTLSGETDG